MYFVEVQEASLLLWIFVDGVAIHDLQALQAMRIATNDFF